jgi:hypothetical protein
MGIFQAYIGLNNQGTGPYSSLCGQLHPQNPFEPFKEALKSEGIYIDFRSLVRFERVEGLERGLDTANWLLVLSPP